ncbi:MAG TPA: glycosyltransferase family 4 protein [Terriglobia bacterium]|nr:glycosyltransferase family 4 protein [Terriglobia bacterium]
MHIAQVAPLYESVPPRLYGGTERVVCYITEELVRQGHDVTLFASGDSVTTGRLVPACRSALRLDTHCVDRLAAHYLMLEKVLRAAPLFDVIHYHVDYLHFSLSRRCATPHVTTLHGRLDTPELGPLFREFSEIPLVSVSSSQRAPLAEANWQGTVHHGLPLDLLPLDDGKGGYLAFLGRISPEKRLDRAIEIARRAGMRLKIAAKVDAVDQTYFDNEIDPLIRQPHVEFIGEIGECAKAEFLGKARALLFPIDWPEPFGLVMIESLSCGTPVVAFRGGSVEELIEDGVTGFVVDGMDSAVRAVKRIGEIDRRRCRAVFEDRFSARRMAADYLAIYDRVCRPARLSMPLEVGGAL